MRVCQVLAHMTVCAYMQVPEIVLTGAGGADDITAPIPADGSAAGTPIGQAAGTSFYASGMGAGRMGMVSFHGPPSAGAPPLRVNDETLRAVSEAVMGRLDVVDLIGECVVAILA